MENMGSDTNLGPESDDVITSAVPDAEAIDAMRPATAQWRHRDSKPAARPKAGGASIVGASDRPVGGAG